MASASRVTQGMIDRRADDLKRVLNESRNGANQFFRYMGRLCISDGARDAAGASASYWIFDLLWTEVVPKHIQAINSGETGNLYIKVESANNKATIRALVGGGRPAFWEKHVSYTDFPEGTWDLYELGPLHFDPENRCTSIAAILLSEH